MASVAVNVSTLGANNLGISVAGKIIRVRAIYLYAAGAVSLTIQDTTPTSFSGPIPLTTTMGLMAHWNREGHFDLGQGKDLNLNLSAAVAVTGWIDYDVVG